MFKRVLCFWLSVLLLATVGCTRSKEETEKESADAAAVEQTQTEVETIKQETDATVERAKSDFENKTGDRYGNSEF